MEIRKIKKEEFEKLRRLFPDNEDMWIKYKKKRLEQFEKKEIDWAPASLLAPASCPCPQAG